jgi:Mg-chelatase subunit ChlD
VPARADLPPLRRKPKRLTERPALLDLASSLPPEGGDEGDGTAAATGDGVGDGVGALRAAVRGSHGADPEVRRRAAAIAARLAIPRPRRRHATRPGVGPERSLPFAGGSDELDLDRTVELLLEHPRPTDEDVVVREPRSDRRSVVLLVDVSGSMRGERVLATAAVVGAICQELATSRLGVLAFWSQATWLTRLDEPTEPVAVIRDLLALPTEGLTNLAFPLEIAGREHRMGRSPSPETVLLSDCVHNAGPDPRGLVSRTGRLGILLDATDEHDADLAADLARLGRGPLQVIRSHQDVPEAVRGVFPR